MQSLPPVVFATIEFFMVNVPLPLTAMPPFPLFWLIVELRIVTGPL